MERITKTLVVTAPNPPEADRILREIRDAMRLASSTGDPDARAYFEGEPPYDPFA